MRKSGIILLVCLWVILYSFVAFADAAKLTKQANRLYQEEKYGEAVKKYKEAADLKPGSDIIHFDMGAALYKKEDFKNAVDESTKALSTEKVSLEAKANYNIGNTKYRLGLLEESIDYYKMSIELDTGDEDAKFNYEFVKKKLEEKQDQQQQQQQKSQSQKEKEEQTEDRKPKTEEKKPEQDKTDRDEKDKERQEEEQKKKQEEEQKKKQEQEEGQEKPPMPKQEKEGMSEGETRMLLESHRQEEESKGEVTKKKIGRPPEVLKDW